MDKKKSLNNAFLRHSGRTRSAPNCHNPLTHKFTDKAGAQQVKDCINFYSFLWFFKAFFFKQGQLPAQIFRMCSQH